MLSSMTWHTGSNRASELEKLGKLTVRLIRIMTYEQLARAQAQLRASGVTTDFLTPYKKHASETLKDLVDE